MPRLPPGWCLCPGAGIGLLWSHCPSGEGSARSRFQPQHPAAPAGAYLPGTDILEGCSISQGPGKQQLVGQRSWFPKPPAAWPGFSWVGGDSVPTSAPGLSAIILVSSHLEEPQAYLHLWCCPFEPDPSGSQGIWPLTQKWQPCHPHLAPLPISWVGCPPFPASKGLSECPCPRGLPESSCPFQSLTHQGMAAPAEQTRLQVPWTWTWLSCLFAALCVGTGPSDPPQAQSFSIRALTQPSSTRLWSDGTHLVSFPEPSPHPLLPPPPFPNPHSLH